MQELKDYILVLDDIISEKICDDILSEYSNSNEWKNSLIGHGHIDKGIRNCTNIFISSDEVIEKNKEIRKKIDNDVFECTKKAIEKYNEKFNLTAISRDTGYNLFRYEKDGFYNEHVDSFITFPRTISCSFILNNNFEGGDFSFFNNRVIRSLKKGSAIMFPSNFLYPHSILPVIDGTRYSIVTWFI